LGDFGELVKRPGRAGQLHGWKNGGNQPDVYFARALDRRMDPDYIKIRVEKEKEEWYISCYYC